VAGFAAAHDREKETMMSAGTRAGATALLIAALLPLWQCVAQAAESGTVGTVALVASRHRADPLYERTVIVVKPLQSGEHIGFIVNKPTKMSLADVFPGDDASKKVTKRVYLGGGTRPYALHAVVAGHIDPDFSWMELAPYIHVAVEARALDQVIRNQAGHARFFAGTVVWQPGELEEQMKYGAWHVVGFEPEYVFGDDTTQLWDRLVTQAESGGSARF
jgi:putative transcriptional regulator